MTRKTETVAHLDASIARWKTRLKRSVTMIDKLEKKRKRLAAKSVEPAIKAIRNVNARMFIDAPDLMDGDHLLGPITEKVVVFEPEPMVKVTSHPVANPDNVKLTFEPATPVLDRMMAELASPPSESEKARHDKVLADSGIPEFLRRGQAAQKAVDEVIADQIREEQAATKKKKAQGRIATMKAKKAGETKKMPLTGKAALDAIRNG